MHVFLGPAIGAFLYDIGGFCAPFFSMGALAILVSIMLVFSIPDVQSQSRRTTEDNKNILTMSGIAKVCVFQSTI